MQKLFKGKEMKLEDWWNEIEEDVDYNKLIPDKDLETLHVIGTCGDCAFYVAIKGHPSEHLITACPSATHVCESAMPNCPEFPHKDFGCIHWEEKKK